MLPKAYPGPGLCRTKGSMKSVTRAGKKCPGGAGERVPRGTGESVLGGTDSPSEDTVTHLCTVHEHRYAGTHTHTHSPFFTRTCPE